MTATIQHLSEVRSSQDFRDYLVKLGFQAEHGAIDQLLELGAIDQVRMGRSELVAIAEPEYRVIWVSSANLPLDLLRKLQRRLADAGLSGLVACTTNWDSLTLYLLRSEDREQGFVHEWSLNLRALRPADLQALRWLDITRADPFDLGQPFLQAFRRAKRPTLYTNQGLFSNYYLNQRLDHDYPQWRSRTAKIDPLAAQVQALIVQAQTLDQQQTLTTIVQPILQTLGWELAAGNSAVAKLSYQGQALAFCRVLPFGASLDLDVQSAEGSPDLPLIGALVGQEKIQWAILTNGQVWRLIFRQATSASGTYYEIDLDDLLSLGEPVDWSWFSGFFGAAWFAAPANQPSFLSKLYQLGQVRAEELGKDLKLTIYQDVFLDLAQALLEAQRRRGVDTDDPTAITLIYRATLLLLYRLLFILYAEARELLPLQAASYYPHSLTYLLSSIALVRSRVVQADRQFTLSASDWRIWHYLQALFAAIADGRAAWGVPRYNGGLFAANADSSAAHQLLDQLTEIDSMHLAKALDCLAREKSVQTDEASFGNEHKALRLIDYMDLDVQRLGGIYEGLLEHELNFAPHDGYLTKGAFSTKASPTGRFVPKGEFYLAITNQDRKSTGSYYTPDYIVRYIVEQTLKPILDQRKATFREAINNLRVLQTSLKRTSDPTTIRFKRDQLEQISQQAIDSLLDIKVLDPAMGSGHFLVTAVNYLSDQLIAIVAEYPDNPLMPQLQTMREAIKQNLLHQQLSPNDIRDEQLSDRILLRRMVMKRCIFGVDLNDLAVELAKLSLWLDSFTVGAPLSFLDHHLKHGNSLIGVWDVEQAIVLGSPRWNEFMRALANMVTIANLTDSTITELEQSYSLYTTMQQMIQPQREQLHVDLANQFISISSLGQARRVPYTPAEQRAEIFPQATLDSYAAAQTEAQRRHFFHWKLEFPEVFVDVAKGDWKQQPGFDVVIGNPPYGAIFDKKEENYITKEYEYVLYRVESYICFMELSLDILRHGGNSSFIVPDTWMYLDFTEKLRKYLIQELNINKIIALPRSVFDEASVDTSIYVISKNKENDNTIDFISYKKDLIITNIDDGNLYHMTQSRFDRESFIINPYMNDKELAVIDGILSISNKMNEISFINYGLKAYQKGKGKPKQDDQIMNTRPFTSDKKENDDFYPFFEGGSIERYNTLWEDDNWINWGVWLAEPRNEKLFLGERLVFRKVVNSRLLGNLISGKVFSNTLLYTIKLKDDVKIQYKTLLAILNSGLQGFIFSRIFAINSDDTFPQILLDDFSNLPIRKIHFTTEASERQRLLSEARHLTERLLQNPTSLELSHSAAGWPRFAAEAYRASELGQLISRLLPTDAQANFVAFAEGASGAEEHSDVVHDLLAELAQQMIDLNASKQTEVKRFLSWLEHNLAIQPDNKGHTGIDSLKNKTKLQNYLGDYQKNGSAETWSAIHAVLSANKSRLLNNHWLEGMFEQQLRGAYEQSLTLLQPIKAQLARTDALIDQLVYQLYGLTPAEIRVVEGQA
ncbi:N-6 DNA methylase [Herpetosiphon gulosus]|uniref:site-specific DNA-methyltransferase (adenine-specific) n=1 Tax=Herpetosiphon gulosus TaxID=1973496 RepID=A0ABP9WYM4_9CHLR